jgi:hypothetical protein
MAARKNIAARTKRANRKSVTPDLPAILGRFAEVRSVIECVRRSLSSYDPLPGSPVEEATTLRIALAEFSAAYNELDKAIARLP